MQPNGGMRAYLLLQSRCPLSRQDQFARINRGFTPAKLLSCQLAETKLAETTQKRIVVAIDGPAGAGKSTIAKGLAARLGFTYIDTGAMYRAVALWAVRQGVDTGDMHRMEQLAVAAGIELSPGRIALNGEDVTDAIRTPEVSSGASKIAVIPGVRRAMVAKQREIGERPRVGMGGRGIGTPVFPNSDVENFPPADPPPRAPPRPTQPHPQG